MENPIRTVSFGPFFFGPPGFVCGPDTHAEANTNAETAAIKTNLVCMKSILFCFANVSD
jgi:hypothetical protein